ncbi:MAG: hypothetical protein WA865_07895 [Spirulinaceae cyanobacterium]
MNNDDKQNQDGTNFKKAKNILSDVLVIGSLVLILCGKSFLGVVMEVIYFIIAYIDLFQRRKDYKNRELIRMTRIKQLEAEIENLEKYWQDKNNNSSLYL